MCSTRPPAILCWPGSLVLAASLACKTPSNDTPSPWADSGLSANSSAPTPVQRFFDWTDLCFEPEEYAQRRSRLMARLAKDGGGVFLAPSAVGRSLGGTFRQLDDFEYLTGLELPDSVLALDADRNRVTLFLPDHDARFASSSRRNDFPGRPLGADPEIGRRSGLSDLRPATEFEDQLIAWEADQRQVRLPLRDLESPPSEAGWVHPRTPLESLASHISRTHPELDLRSGFAQIAALRSVKSAAEIRTVRAACDITCDAIRHAARFVRDGVSERDLEAELEAAFKRGGAQRLAFDSIIKSGPNSLWPWRILAAQYDRRNRVMRSGELVIFDVGCELDRYASDIGRTFPVSGRFSATQRAALEMVNSVSDEIIAAIRPGITLRQLQEVAVAAIPEHERPHMQTGLFFGHPIGLNVGDAMPDDFELQPGTIFTVEPWYYNHSSNLAVFVEDNILVTRQGSENLTADLPRSPADLERLMENSDRSAGH